MNTLRRIHTAYCFIVFLLLFLVLLPLFCIPILFPKKFKLVGIINRWWAKFFFLLCFMPYSLEFKSKLDQRKQYVFCPNHFSYLDIPTMGLNPVNAIFVGKSETASVPLFGWMYSKLHITVDRTKLKSRFEMLQRSVKALEEGKSLVIYPEGGMLSSNPPQLANFKDGPFRIAIEKQVPIVPVTIPFNWLILPEAPAVLRRGRIKVVFHEPIETQGMTSKNVDDLKDKVYYIILTELQNHESRQDHI